MWEELNLCWLALLQSQKDTVQQHGPLGSSHHPVLTKEVLNELGDKLINICDELEPHGLVDYEMGLWEEEIISGKHAQIG